MEILSPTGQSQVILLLEPRAIGQLAALVLLLLAAAVVALSFIQS
jgi:hypothetical protein